MSKKGKPITIFISYAMADSERLDIPGIAKGLMKESPRIKMHYWEGWDGYPDGDLISFMEEGIQTADIFVPICTEDFINSRNCDKERKMAAFQNKRVIPIFEEFKFVPAIFQPRKGIKVLNKTTTEIVDELFAHVMAIADRRSLVPKKVEVQDLKVDYCDMIWFMALDSGRVITGGEDLKAIAEDLLKKTGIVEGMIRYYGKEELTGMSDKEQAFIHAENDFSENLMNLTYQSDLNNINTGYLSNYEFFRAELTSMDVVFAETGQSSQMFVYLLFHKSGIFLLEFYLSMKDMALTPSVINLLQAYPLTEEEMTMKIPVKLLKAYSKIEPTYAFLTEKKEEKILLNVTNHEIMWMYWSIIVSIVTNSEGKDSKALRSLLRYDIFHWFPFIILPFTSFKTPQELLSKYKADIYAIHFQKFFINPQNLRPRLINEAFSEEKNLADRTDYGLFLNKKNCLLIYSQESDSILQSIAKAQNVSQVDRVILETRDILHILEILHLQHQIFMTYNHLTMKKSFVEMNKNELEEMQRLLIRGLEELYSLNSLSRSSNEQLEAGRKVFGIDKSIEILEKKLTHINALLRNK